MSRIFFFIREGLRALRRSAAPSVAAIVNAKHSHVMYRSQRGAKRVCHTSESAHAVCSEGMQLRATFAVTSIGASSTPSGDGGRYG